MVDTKLKNVRVLAEKAPREAAAVLLRLAAGLAFEADRILGRGHTAAYDRGLPDAMALVRFQSQAACLMLAIDDLVAQLEGNEDERTHYTVVSPDPEDD